MAAFNFPNSPSVNDIHTENGVSFKWNGTIWNRFGPAYTDTTNLNVTGISTFGGTLKIPSVAGTNNAAYQNILHQTSAGIIDGGSGLQYHPANDQLSVNGTTITSGAVYSSGGSSLKLADANYSSTTNVLISNKVEIAVNDNVAGAFKLKEGSNEYITVDTTNSSELIKFGTAGTERLRITGDGPHLLLGGTSDVNEITESSANAGMVIGGTGYGNAGLAIITSNSGAGRLYFGDNILSDAGRNRGAIIYYHGSDHMHFQTAGSERMRITADGELLVGTTADNGFKFKVSDGGGYEFAFAPNDSSINSLVNYNRSGGAYVDCKIVQRELQLWAGGSPAERLRIVSDGKIVIGGNYANSGNFGRTLLIDGTLGLNNDSGLTGMGFSRGHASTYGYIGTGAFAVNGGANDDFSISSGSTGDLLLGTAGGTERLRILSGGEVVIGNTASTFGSALLSIEKASTTIGPRINLYNGQASATNATCEIHVGQNYRDANRIIFGRENANNWQSSAAGAASFMAFYTNSAGSCLERMRITSAGYVTSPRNPKFWYSGLSNSSTSGATDNSGTLLFTNNKHNEGSNYNTSTGRFTAPIAGTYHFSVNLLIDNSSGSTHYYGVLQRNGSNITTICYTYSTSGHYHGMSGSACCYMAVGDYVSVWGTSSMHTGNETSFSGHLIG